MCKFQVLPIHPPLCNFQLVLEPNLTFSLTTVRNDVNERWKCVELILLDDSNYESWCISILNNIEAFNPYLLSIVTPVDELGP
jgi:hypothetical protein